MGLRKARQDHRINAICFGQDLLAQGKIPHTSGLDHGGGDIGGQQGVRDLTLVATGCFHGHTGHGPLTQVGGQVTHALLRIRITSVKAVGIAEIKMMLGDI